MVLTWAARGTVIPRAVSWAMCEASGRDIWNSTNNVAMRSSACLKRAKWCASLNLIHDQPEMELRLQVGSGALVAVMGCMSSILIWKVCWACCLHTWSHEAGQKGCLSEETCRLVWGVSSGRLLLGIFSGWNTVPRCWGEALVYELFLWPQEEPKGWSLARPHPSHLERNYEGKWSDLFAFPYNVWKNACTTWAELKSQYLCLNPSLYSGKNTTL